MKTVKKIFMVCGLALIAQVSFGQIAGTLHDFSGQVWNATGEICIVCHTPHNSDLTVPDAPLWNHEVTATVFTLYNTSPTFDGVSTITQPDGSSKLCLSCHDGTVALENFGATTTGTNLMLPTSTAYVGTSLQDDHPISFNYDAALVAADGGGLYDPLTTVSGLGGFINDDMLFATKLQCASCHDVHGTAFPSLLRKSNAGSALCLTCHNK